MQTLSGIQWRWIAHILRKDRYLRSRVVKLEFIWSTHMRVCWNHWDDGPLRQVILIRFAFCQNKVWIWLKVNSSSSYLSNRVFTIRCPLNFTFHLFHVFLLMYKYKRLNLWIQLLIVSERENLKILLNCHTSNIHANIYFLIYLSFI